MSKTAEQTKSSGTGAPVRVVNELYGRKKAGCAGGCWSAYADKQPEQGAVVDTSFYLAQNPDTRPKLLRGVTFVDVVDGELTVQASGGRKLTCPAEGLVWHPVVYETSVCCAFGLTLQVDWWKRHQALKSPPAVEAPAPEAEAPEVESPEVQEEVASV